MHIHRDAAEAFYVLEGTYQMYFESREELAPAGAGGQRWRRFTLEEDYTSGWDANV